MSSNLTVLEARQLFAQKLFSDQAAAAEATTHMLQICRGIKPSVPEELASQIRTLARDAVLHPQDTSTMRLGINRTPPGLYIGGELLVHVNLAAGTCQFTSIQEGSDLFNILRAHFVFGTENLPPIIWWQKLWLRLLP